jgi:hypothetical protein
MSETVSTIKQVSLESIADGVASELFSYEIQKIARNIADKNTAPIAARSLTLKFDFKPDESREEVKVTVSAKTSLAPVKGYTKTIFTGQKDRQPALFSHDTKQIDMFTDNSGITPMKASQQ